MPIVKFHIGADGKTQCLYTDALSPLVAPLRASTSRISHIEPVRPVLRGLFHLARRVFGEDGRVGRWLRTWQCRWRVNFGPIGGGIYERDNTGRLFASRQAAIDFELALAATFLKEGRVPC